MGTEILDDRGGSSLDRILSNAANGRGGYAPKPDNRGSRRNRAQLHDDEQPAREMLEPSPFTELDRGNLQRIAVAIEELNQVFKTTAKIEVTNNAIDVLAGLVVSIKSLDARVDQLGRTLDRMTKKRKTKGEMVKS